MLRRCSQEVLQSILQAHCVRGIQYLLRGCTAIFLRARLVPVKISCFLYHNKKSKLRLFSCASEDKIECKFKIINRAMILNEVRGAAYPPLSLERGKDTAYLGFKLILRKDAYC